MKVIVMDFDSGNQLHTKIYKVKSVGYCDNLRTAVLSVTLM